MSGTACVTLAGPWQCSDAVGNGRGGEGKQQLVGKGGKDLSEEAGGPSLASLSSPRRL